MMMAAVKAIGSWLGGVLGRWLGGAWWVVRTAPWIMLFALLTEGAQHVAEIQLGMFESRAAFTALANDAVRWTFGYAKIAGLILTLLIAARAIALGSPARAVRPGWWALGLVVALLAVTTAIDLAAKSAAALAVLPEPVLMALNLVAQTVLTVFLLAALFEDTLIGRRGWWQGFKGSLVMIVLAALAFVPMQLVHGLNHRWALGAPDAAVWALMAFDTLWIGALAVLLGSALATGWRACVPNAVARAELTI